MMNPSRTKEITQNLLILYVIDNNKDIVVNLPSTNQDAINRLLAIKPF